MTFDTAPAEIQSDAPSYAERGRLGGHPVTSGSIQTVHGGIKAATHVARLRNIAERTEGKDRAFLLAAIECIEALAAKNRRLGGQVGGRMRRALLTHRGVMLSGKPEDIAADLCELAAGQTVIAYREKRWVRVTSADLPKRVAEHNRIGTYDSGCDYRQAIEDVREALR